MLNVKGMFEIELLDLETGEEIYDDNIYETVFEKLTNGDYIIGFQTQKIYDTSDGVPKAIFAFNLSTNRMVEYIYNK